MAYVYQHIRLDTDEVFYIGIGSDTEGKYSRANKKEGRNPHWHNIVTKANYKIEILNDGISWEEACEEEILLIKNYGRRDLNEGMLVNMTNGGDGAKGIIFSKESKQKMSESQMGKIISEKTKQKLRDIKKGKKMKPLSKSHRKKISESNKGKILSNEHRQKISEIKKGKKRPSFSEQTKRKMSDAKKGNCYAKLNTTPPKPHQFF
jgi:hypothetical protein